MREIKFRGKRIKIEDPMERWVEGSLIDYTNIRDERVVRIMSRSGYMNDVNPETIGQFSGLKDKNGKEIYEGDLIKAPSGSIYAVIFSTWKHEEKRKFPKVIDLYEYTGWCISLDWVNPCDLLDSEVCQGNIIGNIYDNPELLSNN